MADHPELNYCPQCAAPLIDRQAYGRRRRYCPVCQRVMYRDPKVAAGVLVEQDGQVLLVQRATGLGHGLWSLPAGFIEYDEDPGVTAVRECLEETGLEVELGGLLDVIPGSGLTGEASFFIVYTAEVRGGALHAGDDAQEAGFFDLDDLPPLAFDSTGKALQSWSLKHCG